MKQQAKLISRGVHMESQRVVKQTFVASREVHDLHLCKIAVRYRYKRAVESADAAGPCADHLDRSALVSKTDDVTDTERAVGKKRYAAEQVFDSRLGRQRQCEAADT